MRAAKLYKKILIMNMRELESLIQKGKGKEKSVDLWKEEIKTKKWTY